MQTIEPNTQKEIIRILPQDGDLAIDLMCQLLANMILSINKATIDKAVTRLKFHLDEYEGI